MKLGEGGVHLTVVGISDNRYYIKEYPIQVPWLDKKLKLSWNTFRDKVRPGDKETVDLKITNADGTNADAELLVAMYDKSLDQFMNHQWQKEFYPQFYNQVHINLVGFGISRSIAFRNYNRSGYTTLLNSYSPQFDWHIFNLPSRGHMPRMHKDNVMVADGALPMMESRAAGRSEVTEAEEDASAFEDQIKGDEKQRDQIKARENLNETVFFYPQLRTNENGNCSFEYTMNEALTQWHLLVFAHDKQLSYIFDTKTVQSSKPLMVEPLMPRFLRQGDFITVSAKVSNLTDKPMTSDVLIELEHNNGQVSTADWVTSEVSQLVELKSGESKVLQWQLNVPNEFNGDIQITTLAASDNFSDGEKNTVIVLPSRILVTESMPFFVGADETKLFSFESFEQKHRNKEMEDHQFLLDYNVNPSWIVLKALPQLLYTNNSSTLQYFDAYFAAMLGRDLVSNQPKLKSAIQKWINSGVQSPLFESQDLKISDIQNTPWLSNAQKESHQIEMLSTYLDDNNVKHLIDKSIKTIMDRQQANGGFSWMPGGRDNWYITQYILEGFARLKKLGLSNDLMSGSAINNAVQYCDQEIVRYHNRHEKDLKRLSANLIHYLFVRAHYPELAMNAEVQVIFKKYLELARNTKFEYPTYQQGMLAYLFLIRDEKKSLDELMESLSERMVQSETMGYYWNDQAGYYWYEDNLEKQALLIDLFKAFDADDQIINGLQLWLLRHKQVNAWSNDKATAAAVYAFSKANQAFKAQVKQVDITWPQLEQTTAVDDKNLSGTQVKVWESNEITKGVGTVEVSNPNSQPGWGHMTWQYF